MIKLLAICWLLAIAALPVVRGQNEDLGRIYQEARQAEAARDLTTAASKYESIVKIRPDIAEAFANLGNVYYQQGKTEKAAVAYKRAIALKPQLTGPYFFLGMMAFHQRAYQDALRYLRSAERLEPQNAAVHSYLGYTNYALGAYNNAASELEKALDASGVDQDVLYHLSKSYSHLAAASFDKLVKRFPNSFQAHLAEGHLYETRQEWKRAEEEYEAALKGLPGNAALRRKHTWISEKAEGKASESNYDARDKLIDGSLVYLYGHSSSRLNEEIAARGVKAKPSVSSKESAEALYFTGEDFQILSYLASLEVIRLQPGSYRAKQLEAQLLENSGKDDEAIAKYREVAALEPNLKNTHFAIGNLHWKRQQFAGAAPELQKELKIDPNHPQALYELGDIAVVDGKSAEAEEYFLKALKYEPNMIEAHYGLEKIYTEADQYEKSIRHLNAALKLAPSDPTPHYRLARIYRRQGRTAEADAELQLFESMRNKTGSPK